MFCLQADFIGPPRRRRRIPRQGNIEDVTEFKPQKILKVKSKERPNRGDRSFEACQTRYLTAHCEG